MKSFRKKYPLWAGLIVLGAAILASLLGSGILLVRVQLRPEVAFANEYRLQLVAELLWMLIMVFLTMGFGMEDLFFESRKDFLDSLKPAAVLLVIYLFALLGEIAVSVGMGVRPLSDVVYFVLCMAMIGLTEELTFRGLMTGMVYEKYGTTPMGVWFTVLSSSLLFGAMHFTNLLAAASFTGVLAQVGAATILGTVLAAIYLRTKNYWAVAAVHGFMDFCALFYSGVFYSGSVVETIGEYSIANVLAAMLYLLLTLFLLRPKKMAEILLPGAPARRVKGKAILSIGILAALMAAVILLLLI